VNSGYYNYATQPGFSGYAWTISSGGSITSVQGTNQVQVTWNIDGAQWIRVSHDSTGSQCPATATRQVTVRSLPGPAVTISGPPTVCAGDNGIIYSTPPISGSTVYVWSVPPGVMITSGAGTDSITVDFTTSAASGIITVLGNNICGNGDAASLPVVINPVPSSPSISFINDTLVSSAPLGNQWYLNGAPIPGATQQIIPAPLSGEYWCSVTLNNCSSDTSNHILVLPEGITGNGSTGNFLVYPNPATEKITVETPETLSFSQYSVMNVNGQQLITREITQPKTQLDISNLSAGVYILRLTSDRTTVMQKFVKQ